MPARLAGKLLTSPVAFLVAGILDFTLFTGATIGRSVCCLTHRMPRSANNIAGP